MSSRVYPKPPNGDRPSALYWTRDGKPLDKFLEEEESRVVEQTTLGPEAAHPGFLVSTVFLMIEHGFDEDGRPYLFETMVFPKGRSDAEDILWARYTTEAAAKYGHAQAVRRYSDRVVDATIRLGGSDG